MEKHIFVKPGNVLLTLKIDLETGYCLSQNGKKLTQINEC